jgi:MFS family permease|tara:strand:+ start:529 stop:1866 length:1338 start_codon:yes stop_codon:yes gene_type:complete
VGFFLGKKLSNSSSWPKPIYAWFFTSILLFAYIISFIDRQMINYLVVPIKEDMGLTDFEISFIQGWGFVLAYIIFSIPFGRIVDKVNRVRVLIGGIIIWSVATAACGFSKNSWQLVLSRSGVGAGEAALTPASWSIISDLFPVEKRSFPMSIYLMGPYIGQGLSLLFGAQILRIYNEPVTLFESIIVQPWQIIFLIIAVPGIILGLFMFSLKDPERKEGLTGDREENESIREVFSYIIKNIGAYMPLLIGSAFIIVLLYGLQSWVPTFLHRIHGWEHTRIGDQYGLVALFAGSLGVISGPVFERYLTKLNYNPPIIILCIITSIALTILGPITFLSLSSDIVLIGIFITSFFITFPLALFATSLQNITPNQYRGVVSGLYVFTVNIVGYGLGPMVVAFFTDKVFKSEMAIDLSMATMFLICGPISFFIFYFGRKPFARALASKSL